MRKRVVVLGSGVDELVAASYLALSGCDVTMLAGIGPADERFEAGWVPPRIVRDLDLARFGLEIVEADPLAAVLPSGEHLELTRDVRRSAEAIARVSASDAAKWPQFCDRMHTFAGFLERLYCAPPPDPLATSFRDLGALAGSALRVRGLGRDRMHDLFRLATMSAADLLDEWFESDSLKGLLGGLAVTHLAQGPRAGGTAFNLLHHHVGSAPGVFRPPYSNVRSVLLRRAEGETRNASAARIEVNEGRVRKVVLESGEAVEADAVVSGLTPARTLLELSDPGRLDPELARAIRNVRSRGVAARIALTLDRAPRFTTLVLAPSLDCLERAYDDFKYGRISRNLYLEARCIKAARQGQHGLEVHVQYVPHDIEGGGWDTESASRLARTVTAAIAEHVPGLAGWVMDQHVMTPADLEHISGCPEGQPYHAELGLDQILWMRPVPALAQYRTPIEGLYLCGPAMHPGGGIAGAAGANAASVVLRDLKKRKA